MSDLLSEKEIICEDELGESLRSFPVGNYVIFYRAMQDGIEVVRVLSGFRDIPNLFTGD